jgi:hypothetical protein
MASSGMLRHVVLVRTDDSEELSAYIIRVARIVQLGTLAVTKLQEPHDITSQKTKFVIVTAVETSNLTRHRLMDIIKVVS